MMEHYMDSPVLIKIRSLLPQLKKMESKAASLVLEHPNECVYWNLAQASLAAGVSEASFIRFCRRIGYSGYTDFRLALATTVDSAAYKLTADLQLDGSTPLEDIPEKVISRSIKAMEDLMLIFSRDEYIRAVNAIAGTDHIAIFAVANAASVADDAMNKFIRLGKKCTVSSDAHLQLMIASNLKSNDVAIGISHSGQTKQTIEALTAAKQAGAQTICITNHEATIITRVADIKLLTADYETDFSSETMVSRLSQLALVDMLYLGAMVMDYEENVSRIIRQNQMLSSLAHR